MRNEWRWWMLAVLGSVVLARLLARPRSKLSDDDAAVYARELARMQDA